MQPLKLSKSSRVNQQTDPLSLNRSFNLQNSTVFIQLCICIVLVFGSCIKRSENSENNPSSASQYDQLLKEHIVLLKISGASSNRWDLLIDSNFDSMYPHQGIEIPNDTVALFYLKNVIGGTLIGLDTARTNLFLKLARPHAKSSENNYIQCLFGYYQHLFTSFPSINPQFCDSIIKRLDSTNYHENLMKHKLLEVLYYLHLDKDPNKALYFANKRIKKAIELADSALIYSALMDKSTQYQQYGYFH